MTCSITMLSHYAECHCSKYSVLFIFVPNVIMLNVIMINVVLLNVIMLSVGTNVTAVKE